MTIRAEKPKPLPPKKEVKMTDDPALEQAFLNADQATGEGINDFVRALQSNMKKTSGTFFTWQADESTLLDENNET